MTEVTREGDKEQMVIRDSNDTVYGAVCKYIYIQYISLYTSCTVDQQQTD